MRVSRDKFDRQVRKPRGPIVWSIRIPREIEGGTRFLFITVVAYTKDEAREVVKGRLSSLGFVSRRRRAKVKMPRGTRIVNENKGQ